MSLGSTAEFADFKELVRSRTDLVALIGETVSLSPQRGGAAYVGLCPFHDDHNPSLNVYPDRQTYRCWSCSEGGDCFSYLMKHENIGFREALEMLAQRAHLELPKRSGRDPQQGGRDKASLYEILAWAEEMFHKHLLASPEAAGARDYLFVQRRFTPETISKFRIGYHPNDWQWLQDRARGKFRTEDLFAARLVRERRDGRGHYDDFVDRVLFPIRDAQARPVAFGGRILPDHPRADAPKYLNSPESVLFTKSKLLYGFDVAREAVRRLKTAVVVEGYTDCMMAHQYGLTNFVGTLGTALTETHVLALKRFAPKVVLVYDGDEAGQNAAGRSLAKFLAQEVDLRILTLPGGLDPADFLAREGADAFRGLIEQAPEVFDYIYRLFTAKHGSETLDARERIINDMVELLAEAPRLAGHVREEMYHRLLLKLAQFSGVNERTVRRRLDEARRQKGRSPSSLVGSAQAKAPAGKTSGDSPNKAAKINKYDLLECELLEIIFAAPELADTLRQEVALEEFTNAGYRELLAVCYELTAKGVVPALERVLTAVEDPELKRQAVQIDELSREKQIARKLRADGPQDANTGRPKLLEQAVRHLKWRREEETHQLSKGQIAQHSGALSRLDSDAAKELLRLATEFHQKRTTKQTLT